MLLTAFILGFMGSLHCIGMCGPIALALPYGRFGGSKTYVARGIYQLGRLSTYALIGLVLGLMGMSLEFVSGQQYLSIFIGTVLILGIIFPWLYKIKSHNPILEQVNEKVKSTFSKFIHKDNFFSFYISGSLNGLLPCGLVWIALATALALSNGFESSLFMLFFGIGTLPAMFGIVFSFDALKSRLRFSFNRVGKVIALALGLILIVRGLNMGNHLSPYFDYDEAKKQIITICGLDH